MVGCLLRGVLELLLWRWLFVSVVGSSWVVGQLGVGAVGAAGSWVLGVVGCDG